MVKLYILTGQTATGKTKLALELAQKNNGELINFDSRQIYKYLDIVTGKDTGDAIFHEVTKLNNFSIGYYNLQSKLWLYNIVKPNQQFSSFDYQECVLYVIKKILDEGKTPVLVGGTYFYLQHLLFDIGSKHVKPNEKLRETLNNKTSIELQEILKNINNDLFELMNTSDRNNPRRLIRKIEIAESGMNISINSNDVTLENKLSIKDLKIEYIALKHVNKELLQKRIQNRVEERIKNGAIEEVQLLLQQGYTELDQGLQAIGYKQLIAFLHNKLTKEEMINSWVTKEMQYAKRQYTFFKKYIPTNSWREV